MSKRLKKANSSRSLLPRSINFSDLSIQSKLQALLLLVSLGSVVIVGWIGWYQGRMSLRDRVNEQLTGLRATRADQLNRYFERIEGQVSRTGSDRETIEAMAAFNKGFGQLERSVVTAAWDEWNRALETYYKDKFFPRLSKNILQQELQYDSYRPQGQAAQYLQYYYIAQNPNPVGEKEKLLDPGDGSEYTKSHIKYHPLLRQVVEDYGYHNLLLINPKTLDVVYSSSKETAFATSLQQGPYFQSSLAEVIRAVTANPTRGSVQITDFQPYRPSYEAPFLFAATPVYSGANLIGILAVQVSPDNINAIVSNSGNWKSSGLGQTGDSYLVGQDRLMRSVSRFWMEAPDAYKSDARAQGTSEQALRAIESLNTTIGKQPVESTTAQAALAGQEGIQTIRNFRGKEVLSSYGPLKLRGFNWAVLAEIETGEVYKPIYILQFTLLTAAVIFMLGSAFLAGLSARLLTLPLRRLTQSAKKIEAGEPDADIPAASKDEFGELFEAFNGIANRLQFARTQLLVRQQENETLLRNFLPGVVASRLEQGETIIANRLNSTTLLYAHITGIAELSKHILPADATKLLTQIFDEFDALADRYGMERQHAIGLDYIAACGLNQTRFDHTKSTVDFAAAMLNSLRTIASEQKLDLGLQIAIHAGAANAGIVGTKIYGYKLWGEDFELVNRLYDRAEPNAIVVTRVVYEQLANAYPFSPRPPVKIENFGEIEIWMLGGDTPPASPKVVSSASQNSDGLESDL